MFKLASLSTTFVSSTVYNGISEIALSSCRVVEAIKNLALRYLSPKQSIRPDSLWESSIDMIAPMRRIIYFQYWRVQSIFKELIPVNETRNYLTTLCILQKLSNEEANFTSEEFLSLSECFKKAFSNENYLNKFDFFILAKQDLTLENSHKDCKRLMHMKDFHIFHSLQSKLNKILKILKTKEYEKIIEQDKLDLQNCIHLGNASIMSALTKKLHEIGINGMDLLLSRWQFIEEINNSEEFSALNGLCCNKSLGSILLVNSNVKRIFREENFTCIDILHHLFMGKLKHIGIFVEGNNSQTALSHITPKSHEITMLPSPLTLQFHYNLELDIKPLIPKTVSNKDCDLLNQVFLKKFHKFASEKHPEFLPPTLMEKLRVLSLGHINIRKQTLPEFNFNSLKGKPLLCSRYVGEIFLMAIHEVNKKLQQLGYSEKISHPFGEHENLRNLDILRLLYLLKNLHVIKKPVTHPILIRVVAQSKNLDTIFT